MKKIIGLIKIILPMAVMFVLPRFVFAQISQPPITAPQQFVNVNQILSSVSTCAIINWIFWFFIVFSIIMTLSVAFKYLTAAGDPEKVKAASVSLIYIVIGIAVALLAKGFPLIVSSFIGGGITSVGC